jgi:transcriptional regulator with XRE-family HTH domain
MTASAPTPAWQDVFRNKVGYLVTQFSSQSRLAGLLDVDRSRISRWLRSEVPDPDNRLKLEALEFVYLRLAAFLAPKTAEKWLLGVNDHLGGRRPVDLIREGRVAEVVAAAEQFETGAYV